MNLPLTSTFLSGQARLADCVTAVRSNTPPWTSRKYIFAALQEPLVAQKELRKARIENVGADRGFYVDHTCIDCDTCRYMAPDFYKRRNMQSAVLRQPETAEERINAFRALLSCPTYSIHGPADAKPEQHVAEESFPRLVPGTKNCYHCGFHDELSFGGAGYLIQRPEGNVLVDVPRFNPKLVKRIKDMGGVKYMFLTHKDDVGAHYKWATALGAERIMHKAETNVQQRTNEVEHQIEGEGPWGLPDGSEDCEIIFTPGHSEAHCVLLYKPQKVLFSGDHLAADVVGEWTAKYEVMGDGFLGISRSFNCWNVTQQVESCLKLAAYDWLTLLPGHGRPGVVRDDTERKQQLQLIKERETKRGLDRFSSDGNHQRHEADY